MTYTRILSSAALALFLTVAMPTTLWAGVISSDIAVTKTDGAASSIPGDTITYTIVATNNGPADDNAVSVADTFPAALSNCNWTCTASAGSTCTAAGAGNIADSADLLNGGTATYMATCDIDPAATGNLANTATVTASNTDPNAANDSATDTNTLTPTSDISVTKTDGAADSTPGTTITYTIVATNNGPSDDGAVTVTDNFPAALSGCSWTCAASAGSTCTAAGAGNIADSASLLSGGTATYTATCSIDPAATGNLANTVTVAGSNTDPNAANDSATDTNTLTPSSDLSISMTFNPPSPQTGEPFTITVMVDNAGPSDATNVVVTLTTPPGLSPSTTGCAEDPNGVPTCTLGTVAAGGSAMYTVDLVAPGLASTGTFSASVSADGVDPVPADNDETTDIDFVAIAPAVEVPVVGETGLMLLILLLGAAAVWRVRRI